MPPIVSYNGSAIQLQRSAALENQFPRGRRALESHNPAGGAYIITYPTGNQYDAVVEGVGVTGVRSPVEARGRLKRSGRERARAGIGIGARVIPRGQGGSVA